MFKVRPQDNVVLESCLGCFQIPIRMGEKRRCAPDRGAHLRNSPPSLLMIGNNYLKQLAFGARANSPVSIFPHYPKAVISKLKATQKQKERGRVSPRPS
jgi:hypothetical protein